MKRAIIFYNGNYADISAAKTYITANDTIICADGGAELVLRLGILPQIIIGDLDSLHKKTQKKLLEENIQWFTFPKEKDATDSELALTYARDNGFTSIIIFGLFGSRLDHFLTNIFALSRIEEHGIDVLCIEGKQEIRVMNKHIKIHGKSGDLVSLIPITSDVHNIKTHGLSYPLKNEPLFFGYSRGISNVMITDNAVITCTEGLLLVIHTRI